MYACAKESTTRRTARTGGRDWATVAAPYAAVIATATVRERAQKVICSLLRQVIVQRERVLHTMAHGRTAVSTGALELSSGGTRDHRTGLLRNWRAPGPPWTRQFCRGPWYG